MRKALNFLDNFFEYKYLEFISYILILLWGVSPIVEFIFKNYIRHFYTTYFQFIVYFIGIIGIIEYGIYIYKKKIDGNLKIKKCIPQILIGVMLTISLMATILSNNSYLSFFGEGYRREGLLVYIMYIGLILSASIIKDKKYINKFFKIVVISALFITIIPLFNDNFLYENFSNIYHNTNHYGYFLMISTMLSGFIFFSNKKLIERFLYLIIYAFLLYTLILNDTFGCYLAVFISLLFTFIYSLIKKYKRVDCIILMVIFILLSYLIPHYNIMIGEHDKSRRIDGIVVNNISIFSNDIKKIINKDDSIDQIGTGRGLLWKEAWNYTLEHPIIGGGMECLRSYYRDNYINYNDRPHNIILQFSAFIGIPGAIIYVIFILYLAICNLKYLDKNAVNIMIYVTAMCYFISSIFGNSMYYTSPYFMILLGFLMGMNKKIL